MPSSLKSGIRIARKSKAAFSALKLGGTSVLIGCPPNPLGPGGFEGGAAHERVCRFFAVFT